MIEFRSLIILHKSPELYPQTLLNEAELTM